MLKKTALLFGFTAIIYLSSSCGGQHNHGDNQLLQQAADIHTEAIKIEKELRPKLQSLVQQKNTINIQGRALTEEETAFVNKVESIEASLKYWEENHVEVPGFEHGHDHDHDHEGHDHSHDHGSKLEVAPQDMLLIQKEFRDSIVAIQKRVLAL